jgi:hypothetical protein
VFFAAVGREREKGAIKPDRLNWDLFGPGETIQFFNIFFFGLGETIQFFSFSDWGKSFNFFWTEGNHSIFFFGLGETIQFFSKNQ